MSRQVQEVGNSSHARRGLTPAIDRDILNRTATFDRRGALLGGAAVLLAGRGLAVPAPIWGRIANGTLRDQHIYGGLQFAGLAVDTWNGWTEAYATPPSVEDGDVHIRWLREAVATHHLVHV